MSEELTLDTLKPQEQVRLWRARMGLSRAKAGRIVGVSAYTWGEYERGEREFPRELPWHGPKELKGHERCLVMRLRCGVSQAKVAADLDRSKQWVGMMERGQVACDDLLWYWES